MEGVQFEMARIRLVEQQRGLIRGILDVSDPLSGPLKRMSISICDFASKPLWTQSSLLVLQTLNLGCHNKANQAANFIASKTLTL